MAAMQTVHSISRALPILHSGPGCAERRRATCMPDARALRTAEPTSAAVAIERATSTGPECPIMNPMKACPSRIATEIPSSHHVMAIGGGR